MPLTLLSAGALQNVLEPVAWCARLGLLCCGSKLWTIRPLSARVSQKTPGRFPVRCQSATGAASPLDSRSTEDTRPLGRWLEAWCPGHLTWGHAPAALRAPRVGLRRGCSAPPVRLQATCPSLRALRGPSRVGVQSRVCRRVSVAPWPSGARLGCSRVHRFGALSFASGPCPAAPAVAPRLLSPAEATAGELAPAPGAPRTGRRGPERGRP